MAAALRGGQTNYPYAVARVQAKRSRLVPRADYPKILKMDVSEITRFVSESEYKSEVDELASRFRGLELLEAALAVNEERTFQTVRKLVSGDGGQLVDLYLHRFVLENVKTVLRGKAAGATKEELLHEMLLEDFAAYDMLSPLFAEDVKTVDDAIAALERHNPGAREIAKILQHVPQGSPLARYEDELDKHYFASLLATLENSKMKGAVEVRDVVRREVDAFNLQNALRWVHAGMEGDFSAYVIPGGRHFKVAQVMALARAKDLQAFEDQLADTPWGPELRAAFADARSTGRLAQLQSALRRVLAEELDRVSHSKPLSIIPVLLYLTRKHREVVTLRAVARGRAAGLAEARLQELIL